MSLKRNPNKGNSVGSRGNVKDQNLTKRVADIILNDQHPAWVSDDDIGVIFYVDVDLEEDYNTPLNLPRAYPESRNNFTYPLIGELVTIKESYSPNHYSDIGGNFRNTRAYYSPTINVHNNTTSNALPLGKRTKKIKSKTEPDTSGTQSPIPSLGKYFKEKILKPLRPGEGDTIFEGKGGARIRQSMTGPEGTNAFSNKVTDTPDDGNPNIGDAVMALSIGKDSQENITNDAASLYLCENQSIPVDASSTNIDSLNSTYTPTTQPLEEISKPPSATLPTALPEEDLQISSIQWDLDVDAPIEETPVTVETTGSIEEELDLEDPVFSALDESIEEGLLEELTPEEFEFDDYYPEYEEPEDQGQPEAQDLTFEFKDGKDCSFVINPDKLGRKPPATSKSYPNPNEDFFAPSFKKYKFTVREVFDKSVIDSYIDSGDLVLVGDCNVDPKFSPDMDSAKIMGKKYYLHKTCAAAFRAWIDEMDAEGINYRVTSCMRFGKNTGAGPHGSGLAVDFGNLYQDLRPSGSTKKGPNTALRKSPLTGDGVQYRKIASIGAKWGFQNPWRMSGNGGSFQEVWHFEYWGEPLA